MQLRQVILTQCDACVAQQRCRLVAGERQVARADLQNPAFGPQPRDPQRRLGPARQRQPRAVRHVIGQHRQRSPALPVVQHVHVIQDQHQRRRHRRERRAQPRDDRARHRADGGGKRVEDPAADGLHRIERFRDVGEQPLRIVVGFVDGHPRESLAVALSPLRQQRRLPVARRRDYRDDPLKASRRQPFHQGGTAHGPRPHQRTQKLRRQKIQRLPVRAERPAGSLTHVTICHPRRRPPERFSASCSSGARLRSKRDKQPHQAKPPRTRPPTRVPITRPEAHHAVAPRQPPADAPRQPPAESNCAQ